MTDHADTIRRGLGSLHWLLNNAHNFDSPAWSGHLEAAFEDETRARAALDALVAERQQADALREIAEKPSWNDRDDMRQIARAALLSLGEQQ